MDNNFVKIILVIIDSQYTICIITQLQAKALWRINISSTEAHVLSAMDNAAQ